MIQALKEILPNLVSWLRDEDVDLFKIGISNNPEQRAEQYAQHQLFTIAHSNDPKAICQAEKDLIAFFLDRDNPVFEKCENINAGGGGQIEDATFLYIAVKYKRPTIDDLNAMFIDVDIPIVI